MSSRLSLKAICAFSRQMATLLEGGIAIRRALEISERGSNRLLRNVYHEIGLHIEEGGSLADALEKQGRAFPVFFRRLIRVGEMTGGLDVTLKRLAEYYEVVRSAWRNFISQLTYPVVQYWACVFILALVRWIMASFIENGPNADWQAIKIVIYGAIGFLVPIALYFVLTRSLSGLRPVHELLLRVPVMGWSLRTFALARFSWSMSMMTNAGVNIFDAIRWSLEATANGAYYARAEAITGKLRDGVPLSAALEQSGLFPSDYVEMIHVAEESGSMPGMFDRLAKNYGELAELAMKHLSQVIGWIIRAVVAGILIYFIFKFAGAYISGRMNLINSIND